MSNLLKLTKLRWFWLVAVVLIVDLGSKFFIMKNYIPGDIEPLFPSFNLHYVRNYGGAFSFLADKGGWQRWFFVGIAVGICIFLVVLLYSRKGVKKFGNSAYSLIIGGALGNLFDRLWNGFVVDMIDFYIGNWHFATFNFADSAIFIGATLMILEEFFLTPSEKNNYSIFI